MIPGKYLSVLVAILWGLVAGPASGQTTRALPVCPRCGWTPPATRLAVIVSTTEELEHAAASAPAGTTILVRDGTYRLTRMLDLARPNLVLRSLSGERNKVILCGEGMQERTVGVAVSISAEGVLVADLTIRQVGRHGAQ